MAFREACVRTPTIVAQTVPVTSDEPDRFAFRLITFQEIVEAFQRASWAKRLGSGILALSFIAFDSGMFSASFEMLVRDGFFAFLAGIAFTLFFTWLFIDIVLLVLGAGPYAGNPPRLRMLARRCVVPLLACLFAMILFGFIVQLLSGAQGS